MPEPADPVQAQLDKLRRKYGLALPEKVAALGAGMASLGAGPWEEQACAALYRQIHSLTGSSGTYGFAEISQVARTAEGLIKKSLDLRATLVAPEQTEVEGLVFQLREMAQRAASQFSA